MNKLVEGREPRGRAKRGYDEYRINLESLKSLFSGLSLTGLLLMEEVLSSQIGRLQLPSSGEPFNSK